MNRQTVLETIESLIAPYVGKTIAGASTKVHCEKLGLYQDELTPDQVEALLILLEKALRVFIGHDKTDSIIEEIHLVFKVRE